MEMVLGGHTGAGIGCPLKAGAAGGMHDRHLAVMDRMRVPIGMARVFRLAHPVAEGSGSAMARNPPRAWGRADHALKVGCWEQESSARVGAGLTDVADWATVAAEADALVIERNPGDQTRTSYVVGMRPLARGERNGGAFLIGGPDAFHRSRDAVSAGQKMG